MVANATIRPAHGPCPAYFRYIAMKLPASPTFITKDQCDAFHQEFFREQHQQQIQRTCPVVCDQIPEVAAARAVPRVEQTAAFLQLVLQLAEERNVLVIHIYYRDLVASERVYPGYCEVPAPPVSAGNEQMTPLSACLRPKNP